MKVCPVTKWKITKDDFIKFLKYLEKIYSELNSPVEKYWVEAIIKSIEKDKKGYKLDKENRIFLILIATILSLRTRDEVTFKAAKRLFEKVRTPYDVLKLSDKEISALIHPVWFYNNKAKLIKAIAEDIVNKFNWKVPSKLEDLLKLKWVGRKVANLVLSVWFWKPAICVDTHVHRICNRLGIVKTKFPEETEEQLKKILPKEYWNKVNKLLIAFWQTICRPVKPKCDKCFLKDII